MMPSPSPQPPSSSTLWERKGGRMMPSSPSSPLPLPRCGSGRGDDAPHLPPAPFLFHAAVSTTQLTPLPRCGRGAGGEGALTSPPTPLLSHAVGEEGGDERSRGDSALASVNAAVSTTQITPLPCGGRGAGGEGLPQRGRGAGGEGSPHLPPQLPFRSHAVGIVFHPSTSFIC